ncbi:HD-GYP domain-containing protein [Marinospirillum insulare]|uniref:HD-GYP domain-containing protein n=1 Tax=Marinospirillum insulare TaxID=217169 RepID=A0ABQ5ZV03_9GAMM|nr:HD-GYP domain-containing protein [Marinospirillum insulare]GLR62848.1 hypothetical protein GCM10007878_02830 [Marinospirillum insulare]
MEQKPNYQKVAINDLTSGMWVCRLDSDLEDQPFETRGFYFSSLKQLHALVDDCRYVYIDTNRKDTRKLYINIRTQMDRIFADLRMGKALEHRRMRQVLKDLMQAVLHDSKSMLYLAMLREHQDDLVTKAVTVAVLSLAFAKHLALKQTELLPLGMGALLHPIGLLQVPNQILSKSQPLTSDELALVRQYPQQGYSYLQAQKGFEAATLDIVLHHQERVNGSGYPNQLKGKEISFLARIVAITSVYEALTRKRSDRDALSPSKALSQLYRWRFEDFDNRLVEKFIQSLGVYPPGCLVELNTGALAVVYATHPDQRLNPKIKLLTSKDLVPLAEQELVDLAETKAMNIVKALDPKEPRFEKLLKEVLNEKNT